VSDSMFLGLITHPNSKYLSALGVHEKFINLAKDLKVHDFVVNDGNVTDFTAEKIIIRDELLSIFILFITLLRTQTRILLKSRFSNLVLFIFHIISGIYSICILIFKLIFAQFHPTIHNNYKKIIARQHNISEAHINQLINSLNSKFKFSLILEDDFVLNGDYSINEALKSIIDFLNKDTPVQIISISESFNPDLLGFKNVSVYTPFENLHLFNLTTPVTNTVSAMFYKNEILSMLIPLLKSYRKYKIIPIDHKLNMAFAELCRREKFYLSMLSYVSPGLFIQGSIHGTK
jgi:hypothetical protein